MSDEQLEKVIARIQKILARTDHGGRQAANEHEADAAMKLVQELCAKHNLDIATIEASGRSLDTPAERIKEALKGKTRFKWQRDLAKAVAEAHFCYYMLKEDFERGADGAIARTESGKPKRAKTHVFVGRKSNVITAQMMYAYLTQTVEDNAPDEDSRVQIGKTYHGEREGVRYSLKALEDGTFIRVDENAPYADDAYKSLTAAAKFITGGVEVNGYVFWGLGTASTAVSWKEGCADRICERLAQRRADLIAEHDARVRAEEAAAQEAREKAAEEHRRKRALKAKTPTAKEATDAMRDTAFNAIFLAGSPAPIDEDDRPAPDEDDWTPGADVEDAPSPGTALVLASVYDQSEREANEELARGYPPGTFAKWRREAAEREEQRRIAREEAAKREVPDEEWTPGATVKEETPAQAARRKKREAEEYAKTRRRWARMDAKAAREAEREYARKDHGAYRAGQKAGDRVGLDAQVKAKDEQKRLS